MVLIMSRKKVFLLLVSLVIIVSLVPNFVSAQTNDGFLPDIVEDLARFLFVDIANLRNSDDMFVIYSKFLFFWLVFAVLYWGTSKVFKENKNIAITTAIIISIITIVMIPRSMMLFIFESYSVVISFIFGFLPFIVGFIIAHKAAAGDEKWKRILRGIIYIFIGVFTIGFVGALAGLDDPLYAQLGKWASFGGFIALIAGIWNLFGSIGGGGGAGGEGGKSLWNRITGGGKDEGDKLSAKERRELELADIEDKKLKNIIKTDATFFNTDTQIKQYLEKIRNFVSKDKTYGEFINRKIEVLEGIEKVLQLVTNRESMDRKVKNVIRRNKKLLRTIIRMLKGNEKYTKGKFFQAINEESGIKGRMLGKNFAGVNKKLFEEEKKEEKAERVEAYLNKVILKEDKLREGLLKQVETKLRDLITELRKQQPELKKVEDLLDGIIKNFEDIIRLDNDIMKRERSMYKENKFVEYILSQEMKETKGELKGPADL